MKKITVLVLILVLTATVFCFSACEEKYTKITGEGETITRETALEAKEYSFEISDISWQDDEEVDFRVIAEADDKAPRLLIVGQQNILDTFTVSVSGDKLSIKGNRKYRYAASEIIVRTNVKLNSFTANGGFESTISNVSKDFSLTINGATNGDYNVGDLNSVKVSINGAAYLKFFGSCKEADFSLSGAGSIDALSLVAQDVNAVLNGAGKISVYAATSLYAELNGMGEIEYAGEPSVNKQVNGLGTIKHKEG